MNKTSKSFLLVLFFLITGTFISCGNKPKLQGHYKYNDRYVVILENEGVLSIGGSYIYKKYVPEDYGRIEYRKTIKTFLEEYDVKYKDLGDVVYVPENFDSENPEYLVVINGSKVLRLGFIVDEELSECYEEKLYHVEENDDKLLKSFDRILNAFIQKISTDENVDIDKLYQKKIHKFCKNHDEQIDTYELEDYAITYLQAKIATDSEYEEFRGLF
ncbi:MAG: hypothetical protein HUK25_05605 [Treponema sp.]|nr:hypothetical protein [Treponema sp.]